MRTNILRNGVCASIGVLVALPAAAQQAGRFGQLEEVVVTARRIEESLQETPVAVTVFDAEEFVELRGAQDLTALSIAPNVSITNSATPAGLNSAPQPFIRGLGQADFIVVTDPAVGIYLDGVYMARTVGSLLDFVDFQRIEVLRGPQGTLYGRNTIGGAINLISRRVGDELGGRVTASVGSDSLSEVKASMDVPMTIGDDARGGARFSFLRRTRDGYVKDLQYDDLSLGDDDVTAAMASFEAATDLFSARLSLDYTKERETPTPLIVDDWSSPPYPADRPISTQGNEAWYWNDSLHADVCGDFDPVTGAPPAADPLCIGPYWWAPGTYETNQTFHDEFGNLIVPEQSLDTYGASLNLSWDFEFGTFTSITGYRGLDAKFINTFDQTPHSVNTNHNIDFNQTQRSQEFQFSRQGDRVDITAGLYWFNEEAFENVLLLRGRVNPNGVNGGNIGIAAQTYNDYGGSIRFFENPRWIDNTSKAAYLQAEVHATDKLDVTLGVRRTDNDKKHDAALWWITSIINGNVQDCAPFSPAGTGCLDSHGHGQQKAKETTPLLTVSYQLNDSAFVYGTYTEGFRDGGFPARFTGINISGDFDRFTFAEEYVDSLEFGFKGDLLDGRMRLNFALFQTSYTDMQIAGTPRDQCGVSISNNFYYLPGTCDVDPDPLGLGSPQQNPDDDIAGSVINAGEATINGAELEITWAATDNFRLDAALGYLDAKMDCINVYSSATESQCQADGEISLGRDDVGVNATLPRTPNWDINLGFNYSANLQGGELLTRFDWHSVDDQTFSLTDNPFDRNRQAGYDTVDASVTWYPANADWSVTVGGRNLTDELYYNNYDYNGSCACYQGNVVRPRNYYATFRYDF